MSFDVRIIDVEEKPDGLQLKSVTFYHQNEEDNPSCHFFVNHPQEQDCTIPMPECYVNFHFRKDEIGMITDAIEYIWRNKGDEAQFVLVDSQKALIKLDIAVQKLSEEHAELKEKSRKLLLETQNFNISLRLISILHGFLISMSPKIDDEKEAKILSFLESLVDDSARITFSTHFPKSILEIAPNSVWKIALTTRRVATTMAGKEFYEKLVQSFESKNGAASSNNICNHC